MRENYEAVLANVLNHEGGFVNHPKDPGGATNRGITQSVYDAFRYSRREVSRSVAHITEEELHTIYRERYADKIWFDLLPDGVDYAMFDFAVNSGHTRVVRYVQMLLDVKSDGIMGRQTLGAILRNQDHAILIKDLCEMRRRFVRGLKTYSVFGRGWEKRINAVDIASRAMVNGRGVEESSLTGNEGKAEGDQTLLSSISESRRSKAAVVGTAGAVIAAVPDAVELATPAKEAFAFGRYAAVIGAVITLVALIYIIYVRAKRE